MPTIKSGSVLLPDVGMSQSGLMIAALLGGFVVWLAINQKLGAYWSILIGGAATPAATTTTSPTTTPAAPPTNYGGGLVQPLSPGGALGFGPQGSIPGAGVQTTPGMQGD